MSDIANLGFNVDTRGLEAGESRMNSYARTGQSMEKSIDKVMQNIAASSKVATSSISSSYNQAEGALREFLAQQVVAGRKIDENGDIVTAHGVKARNLTEQYKLLQREFTNSANLSDKLSDQMRIATSATDKYQREIEEATKAQNKFDAATDAVTSSLKASENAYNVVNKAIKKASDESKAVSSSFNFVGRSAGQAGIQVQQFVGQLQGGVSPMVALAQQGADLGIVLGAPLVGVIVSLGAVLLGTLLPSLMDSEDAVDDLRKAMEALNKITDVSDEGVISLTKAIKDLADVSGEAAKAKIAQTLLETEDAAKAAAKAIGDAFEVFDADYGFADVTDFLFDGAIYAKGFYEVAEELGEEFGLLGEEAKDAGVNIIRMVTQLQSAPTPENFTKLQEEIAKLSNNADGGTDAAKRFSGSLSEFFEKARSAAEISEFLSQKLNEVGSSSFGDDSSEVNEAADAIDKVIEGLRKQIIAYEKGAEASEEYSIALALGKESFEQVDESVKVLVERVRELKKEQEANDAFESISKQLEGQRIRLEKGAKAFDAYRIRMQAIAAGVAPELVEQLIEASNELHDFNDEAKNTKDLQKDLDDLTKSVEEFGGSWSRTGNIVVDAFGSMSDAIIDYTQRTKELNEQQAEIDKQRKLEGSDQVALDRLQMKVNEERIQAEISGTRSIAGATASLFDEKTAAYKAFAALQQVLTVAEIALSWQKIAASNTETAVHVANEGTKQGANALTAITSAFAAPFPINFVAGAAMIGIMASLLGTFFGGGGSVDPTQQRQETQGTGTVFGSGDKSASIAQSQERFEDIQIDQLAELRGIRDSINSLNGGISNLARNLISGISFDGSNVDGLGSSYGGFTNSFLNLAPMSNFDSLTGGLYGKVVASIFGKTKKEVIDSGIEFFSQSLGEIFTSGEVEAAIFNDIKTTKKKLFGLVKSERTSREFSDLDNAITQQMADIFGFIGDSVIEAATLLGIDTVTVTTTEVLDFFNNANLSDLIAGGDFSGFQDFWQNYVNAITTETEMSLEDALNNYVIDIGEVSFEGLSGEEIEQELQAIFSRQADLIAEYLVPSIAEYQQIGEGLFDTLTRVAQEQVIFNDQIEKMGFALSDLSSVMQIDIAQSIIDLTGGIENFTDLTGSFVDNFFSDSERLAFLEQSLSDVFESLGLSLIDNREEFRDLVQGIDLTTEEGQQLLATLLEINPALSEYIDELERVEAKRFDMNIELLRLQGESERALVLERQAELEAMDESLRALQRLIYAEEDRIALLKKREDEARNAFSMLQRSIALEKERARAVLDSAAEARDAELDRIQSLRDALNEQNELLENNYQTAIDALSASTDAEKERALIILQASEQARNAEVQRINELKTALNEELSILQASRNEAETMLRNSIDLEKERADEVLRASELARDAEIQRINELRSALNDTRAELTSNISNAESALRNSIDLEKERAAEILSASELALQSELSRIQALKDQAQQRQNELEQALSESEAMLRSSFDAEKERARAVLDASEITRDAELDRIDQLRDSLKDQQSALESIVNDAISSLRSSFDAEKDRARAALEASESIKNSEVERVERLKQILNEERSLLESNLSKAESILRSSFEYQIDQINKSTQAQIESIRLASSERLNSLNEERTAAQQASSSLLSLIDNIKTSLGTSLVNDLYGALQLARTGDFSLANRLDVQNLSNLNPENFSSAEEFRVQQAINQNRLNEIAELAEDQLSDQELQLDAIERNIIAVESSSSQQIKAIEEQAQNQIEALNEQLNSLLGIDNSITSLSQAISGFNNAQQALNQLNFESQASAFDQLIQDANDSYELDRQAYENQIQALDDQLNTLLGIDNSVLSVQQAIAKLNQAQSNLSSLNFDQEMARYDDLEQAANEAYEQDRQAYEAQIQALDNQLNALLGVNDSVLGLNEAINNFRQSQQAILEFNYDGEIERLDEEIEQAEAQFEQDKQAYEAQLEALDDQLNALLGIDTSVLELSDAISQLESARLELDQLNYDAEIERFDEMIQAANEAYEEDKSQHQEQLSALDDQLNALLGIDTSVLSLSDAIAQFEQSQQAIQELNYDAQLESFDEMIQAANEAYELDRQAYEDQIQALNSQLNALLGIDTSVLSLEDAIVQFQNAQSELQSLNFDHQSDQLDMLEESANEVYALHEQAYQNEIERLDQILADNEALYNAALGIDDSVISVEHAVQELIDAVEALPNAINDNGSGGSGTIPTGNGSYTNAPNYEDVPLPDIFDPDVIPPQDIPEVTLPINPPPAQPDPQTTEQLRLLREEMERYQIELVRNTRATANILQRFELDGLDTRVL